MKLQYTYEKLLNGDLYYLSILNDIIEYKVTKGTKSAKVEKFLNWRTDAGITLVLLVLSTLAYFSAHYLYVSCNVSFANLIALAMIVTAIIFFIKYMISYLRYGRQCADYCDVNDYVEKCIPFEKLEEAYRMHLKKNDGGRIIE